MAEEQMRVNEEKGIIIPDFMDKRKKQPRDIKKLQYINVSNESQCNWELLKQLNDLVGLVVSGKEPNRGEIKYTFTLKDDHRTEKITGVIRTNRK